MRNFLIKFFGLDLALAEKNSEVAHLWQKIDEKDQEIQRLTNLILTEHGLIRVQNTNQSNEKPAPINKRASWPQVQKDLERADQAVARKQVNDLAEYWQKKDQEALSEL